LITAAELRAVSLQIEDDLSAHRLRTTPFVSADERQLQLARGVGLDIVDLGKRRSRARRR